MKKLGGREKQKQDRGRGLRVTKLLEFTPWCSNTDSIQISLGDANLRPRSSHMAGESVTLNKYFR